MSRHYYYSQFTNKETEAIKTEKEESSYKTSLPRENKQSAWKETEPSHDWINPKKLLQEASIKRYHS